jgi:uncharacterized protein YcfL
MRYQLLLVFVAIFVFNCESATFDMDKRQIVAKDVIRKKLSAARDFDIVSFKEDTLSSWTDSTFKQPIRYTLNFVYTDSTGVVQNKNGVVLFTPDGRSIITAQINNQ